MDYQNAFFSRQHGLHSMPMHIGEAAVNAVGAHGELFVINAEEVQDGGVKVVDVDVAWRT